MQVVTSIDSEASRKGLYALATLLRNNATARQHFYQHSGVAMLTKLLQEGKQAEPVQRKILNLVADLSQEDLNTQVKTMLQTSLDKTAMHRQKLSCQSHAGSILTSWFVCPAQPGCVSQLKAF